MLIKLRGVKSVNNIFIRTTNKSLAQKTNWFLEIKPLCAIPPGEDFELRLGYLTSR